MSGERAVVHLEQLAGDSRVEELAAMLGSSGEHLMLESAQELLIRAGEST